MDPTSEEFHGDDAREMHEDDGNVGRGGDDAFARMGLDSEGGDHVLMTRSPAARDEGLDHVLMTRSPAAREGFRGEMGSAAWMLDDLNVAGQENDPTRDELPMLDVEEADDGNEMNGMIFVDITAHDSVDQYGNDPTDDLILAAQRAVSHAVGPNSPNSKDKAPAVPASSCVRTGGRHDPCC